MHGSKPSWRYYIDFFTFPLVAALVAWFDRAAWSLGWLGLALLGVLLFTFIEYWTHRLILHRLMWHSTHQRHHQHPAEHVEFPLWYLPSIFLGFWLVLPAPVFTGFMVGALWFISWHHILHHWDLTKHPLLRAYEAWHDVHHRGRPYNYGITHPGWDVVFRTYRSPSTIYARKHRDRMS